MSSYYCSNINRFRWELDPSAYPILPGWARWRLGVSVSLLSEILGKLISLQVYFPYLYIFFLASINFFHSYLYFISFQDKQFLEPYGKPRDIAYIVLAPDNDYIINAIILFFKELSNVYELSRMGRHSPVSLKLRDGIMRVGKKIAEKFSTEDHPDDWFKFIGKLLYIHSCLVWIWCAELFTGKKSEFMD